MINARDWIIQQGLQRLEQSQLDQQWLKSWLEQKRTKTTLSLSDYRQRLSHHARLLQNYHIALEEKNEENLSELKRQIEQSGELIYQPDLVREIQIKIRQRKSKRDRLRRQKEKIANDQTMTKPVENIIIFNPSISKKSWFEKIDDIRTLLEQIDQRQQQTSSETIREQLAELKRLCTEKIEEYERAREQDSDIDLYNHLFNNQRRSFYESIDPRAQPFLRAHQNRSNLIEIRQQWDQYLSRSSNDSLLPSQWHTVTSVSDQSWTEFLFEKIN